MIKDVLEEYILANVEKPVRYLNGEWNSVHKNWEKTPVKMVFAFPDVYEIGMSHLGLQILYGLINREDDFLLERTFAPWVDMEKEMRSHRVPLFSLESFRPVRSFDVVGFTLQYEMTYTNVINMLDLSGISFYAEDRSMADPLVIGGGPGAVNPEPLADFFDCFVLGEGEEVLPELLAVVRDFKQKGSVNRKVLLEALASIPGVYVPSFYAVVYSSDGDLKKVSSLNTNAPERVIKRVIADLDQVFYPERPVVPFIEAVHDRVMLELFRGCARGCRFCQAGMIYRPVRERTLETLLTQAGELLKRAGHEEIALTSLSSADYSQIEPLIKEILNRHAAEGVGLSLPSLRIDSFSVGLAQEVQKVRKSGLTFAPEAGTQRLRDVINKGVTEEDLLQAAEAAFQAGWHHLKLYFMIGLPTETKDDLQGIIDLSRKVADLGSGIRSKKTGKKPVRVTVSVSSFVPKSHTPFQWEGQDPLDSLKEKQAFLKNGLRDRRLKFSWHEPELSFLEAVLAKGDRRLSPVLLEAWRKGCRFDSWSEHFRNDLWQEAFKQCGIKPENYAQRCYAYQDVLPWDHLDMGVCKEFLSREHQRALHGICTEDCRVGKCTGCGVCQALGVDTVLQKKGDKCGRKN